MKLFANPELIRNFRAQLRWRRALAAGLVTACLLLAYGSQLYVNEPGYLWGRQLLEVILGAQLFALVIWGGITCLQALHREKELNTFDFQRLTRLTPIELAMGKLFGAPALPYWITLCLMPGAIVGAAAAHTPISFFLASYAILFLGAVVFHALLLVASLFLRRGSALALGVFLIAIGISSIPIPESDTGWALGKLGPFFALDLVQLHSWGPLPRIQNSDYSPQRVVDVFFGHSVHHFYVLIALYATLTAWALLVLARNLKRDPATYRLFTPAQSLAFALYINLILLGFYLWIGVGLDHQSLLMAINLLLFFGLCIGMMNNREMLRQQLLERGGRSSWLAASWPALFPLLGTVPVGTLIVFLIESKRSILGNWQWSLDLGLFRMVFMIAWLIRDSLYLQWMSLRRGRWPLGTGILYLIVYYTSISILLLAFHPNEPGSMPYAAIVSPAYIFPLDGDQWFAFRHVWFLAAAIQVLLIILFVILLHRTVRELSAEAGNAPV